MRADSRVYLPFLIASLLSGCAGTDDDGSAPPEGIGAAELKESNRLPEPAVRRVDPPQLTPEQQRRQAEVDQLLAERYSGYRIVETTQAYSGDIIDWVDSDTIPGARLAPPPPPWSEKDLRPESGAQLARTELEAYPELRGPKGTTPIHRPDFSVYVMGHTDAQSLQDYIANYQVSGQPAGQHRLYAGLITTAPNKAIAGVINQFQGDAEAGTLTLIEAATACRGLNEPTTLELVGAVVSRDRANFGNAQTRIQVEFFTQGPTSFGNNVGGWDTFVTGFVPAAGRPYGPNSVVLASTPGLATQQESRFDISHDSSNNWWVAHNGNWLGYYPAGLFDMLSISACEAAWYGEVYDPTPTDWTWTDMGSGEYDTAGYGFAAYVRNPTYRDLLGVGRYPGVHVPMVPADAACYTRSALLTSGSPWDRFFYLGGNGGNAVGCN
uniref:Neprosin PEP catalytic domain-containing protein n=1 Tax=Sorangium cellulosum TaxID=56 RepID=A0A3S7V009_SORCE|nr:hypothetical protein [Sorangium cellulosum]